MGRNVVDLMQWKPSEIIVHRKVESDSVTQFIIQQCEGIPVRFVADGKSQSVVQASEILSASGAGMLDKILAGKRVLFIAPAGNDTVDAFTMPDDRIICPHFDRLKLASNGCFYQCDWCYLKLTYRAAHPFITVKAEYDKIIDQLCKKLSTSPDPIIFNSGELADSLSLEHLTGAGRKFIPWFGSTSNGYLYMLTKSDNVEDILDLQHHQHTIIAWSMNNAAVSRKYEIGAPPFDRRLQAARRVQQAGYPLRIRLDPIVPFDGWQAAYAETVKTIFGNVAPERITLGTMRFEDGFYKMRNSIFTSGPELPAFLEEMRPMFEPKVFAGKSRPSVGKWSFTEEKRVEIFGFIIQEIRKYSDCLIALCKESEEVWRVLKLEPSRCSCVCQLDYADMS
jgi:spore photoproduct lyase